MRTFSFLMLVEFIGRLVIYYRINVAVQISVYKKRIGGTSWFYPII